MARKFVRIAVYLLACMVLFLAVGVRIQPSTLILLHPGVTIRSPFCDRWSAVQGAQVKLDQDTIAGGILSRLRVLKRDAELELWHTPRGNFWMPKGGGPLLAHLLAQEERNIYGDGPRGVQPGDVVIDCGSFVGTTVRHELDHGARKVVAVEPTPESVECLRRNFASEIASGRVVVCPKGIWDSADTLTFYVGNNGGAGNSFAGGIPGSGEVRIPVTTVDRLVDDLRLERVDYIKADIKGAAKRMLAGAAETIKRDHPRIVIATEDIDDRPEILASYVQRRFPGYRSECGPCMLDGREVYTDVMFFR